MLYRFIDHNALQETYLSEPFRGRCRASSLLPQYLTIAILTGAEQVTSFRILKSVSAIVYALTQFSLFYKIIERDH